MGLLQDIPDAILGPPGEIEQSLAEPFGKQSLVNAYVDIPADMANALTGTGKNLGAFGEFDRQFDPRNVDWDAQDIDKTDPRNTGLSGFFRGASGATTAAGGHLGDLTADPALAYLGFKDKRPGEATGVPDQKPRESRAEPEGPSMLALGIAAVVTAVGVGVLIR